MSFFNYIRIIRPINFVFVIIAVVFGAYYRTELNLSLSPILAAISAVFICSSGYIFNDISDIEIDRINKPNRPLPMGKISLKSAKIYGIFFFVLGFLLVLYLQNIHMIILALFNSVILWLYANKGKQLHILGNTIVAFAAASTFLYGGLANNNFSNSLFIFAAAFLYTMIRELIKDIEDIKGDKINTSLTFPLVYGRKKTLILSIFLALLFNLILIFGLVKDYYNLVYYLIILVFVGLFLMLDLIILYFLDDKSLAFFSEKAMKVDMFLFLIIIWVVQ